MIDVTYEAFRHINQVLPLLACLWLSIRAVESWPAPWARPDHVNHYRVLLVVVTVYVLLSSMNAHQYEASDSPAGPISPAYTVQSLIVLAFCWRWPRSRRWTRDDRAT